MSQNKLLKNRFNSAHFHCIYDWLRVLSIFQFFHFSFCHLIDKSHNNDHFKCQLSFIINPTITQEGEKKIGTCTYLQLLLCLALHFGLINYPLVLHTYESNEVDFPFLPFCSQSHHKVKFQHCDWYDFKMPEANPIKEMESCLFKDLISFIRLPPA